MDKDKNKVEINKIICRCEEVTEQEIKDAIKGGYTTLKEIKRNTRAGMGLCQGRTCSDLIRNIISEMTGENKKKIVPDTSRFPVYPVKLKYLQEKENENN